MADMHVAARLRRTVALAAAFTLCAGASMAQTASNTNASAYQALYATTMKCFVANGIVAGDQRKAGDGRRAALYEQKAKEAFDLTFQAGRKVGLKDARIQGDIDRAQARELPIMMRDNDYFRKAAGECKAAGLM